MKLNAEERADLLAWCLGVITTLAAIQIIEVYL